MRKKAFTLIEILIVVAVLGILAALVVPQFQDYSQKAKESNAKANLKILRDAIERYAAQHNGVSPGYATLSGLGAVHEGFFKNQMLKGKYLSAVPGNPFNHKSTILMINDATAFPTEATGTFGWVYKPETKTIKMDTPGTDNDGNKYYDY